MVSSTVMRKPSTKVPKFKDFLPQWGGASSNEEVLTLDEAMRIL